MAFLLGVLIGSALGWAAYAYRRVASVVIVFAAGCALIITILSWPLMSVAADRLDTSLPGLLMALYDQAVPDVLQASLPWIIVAGVIAHVAAAAWIKGVEPEPSLPETRDAARARVRADMKYSDDYFD